MDFAVDPIALFLPLVVLLFATLVIKAKVPMGGCGIKSLEEAFEQQKKP